MTPVEVGDVLDVAAHHYSGLLGAGLVEPTDKGKAQQLAEAGAAALAVPVAERVLQEGEKGA